MSCPNPNCRDIGPHTHYPVETAVGWVTGTFPLVVDDRFPRLLDAARAWRAGLIPRTSTASANAVNDLLRAIEAFDTPPEP